MFPQAPHLARFWGNILDRVDAITDVPATHWRPEDYFDADPKKPDMTYARRGGFLLPVDFPPLDFGIPPNALEATDATQLLGLMVAKEALASAGYGTQKQFDKKRVSVILGVTGTLELVIPLGARLGHPYWKKALKEAGVPDDVAADVVQRIGDSYVGWQEDSFPGLLGNVVAGRIANRLDLGGTNCVVDAACASSLSAVHLAMMELATGRADMVISGGMDTFNDIFMYMCFSKTPALSPTGNAKPFDASGDGTILGEGLGCILLKRLADAERDGDRIFAVIKSMGTSSDGKGNAIYAPSPAGQAKALRQAYEMASFTPDTVELVEAHGTGTKAGDLAELTALKEVYQQNGHGSRWCAIGSIKSQIGHTKAAAGAAGLIKAALALHHKVLPPTIKVQQPLEILRQEDSPFYVNTQKRPWLSRVEHPRRAAVSSFGFGGSNFHCVLEEYRPEKAAIAWDGAVQILAFAAASRTELDAALQQVPAFASWEECARFAAQTRSRFDLTQPCRLLLVLERDQAEPSAVVAQARKLLTQNGDKPAWSSPEGIYFGSGKPDGTLAFVFPGQGSQYVGMGRDLACQFPTMLQTLAEANAMEMKGPRLSDLIYPPPVFTDAERQQQEETLRATQHAQPALGAISLGMVRTLEHFGVRPAAVAGHSYGELVALCVAGRLTPEELHRLSQVRGQLMASCAGDKGTMVAVRGSLEEVGRLLSEKKLDLVLANKNAPKQVVLSGAKNEIEKALKLLGERGLTCHKLPVSAAFHSPLVEEVQKPFREALATCSFGKARMPVYANATAQEYPAAADAARDLLAKQLASPVEFVAEMTGLYDKGVRCFVEVGASNKLTGLIGAILEGKPHTVFSVDASSGKRRGSLDLARTLAQIAALGHAVELAKWEDEPLPPVEKKPGLTVKISGANYVKPKSEKAPAPAKPNKTVAPPAPAPVQRPSVSVPPTTVVAETKPVFVKPATTPKPMQPTPAAAPTETTFAAQLLRQTQENLLALQRLGEQTAQLHRQFLDSQDRSLQVFQQLLDQQGHLMQTALGQPVTLPAVTAPRPLPVNVPAPVVAAPAPVVRPTPPPPAPVVAAPPVVAPAPPPVVPPPLPAAPKAQRSSSVETLLAVVAEKTGYPAEMLQLEMELDADLGIDSIKRVEIFSTLQEKLPHAPAIKPEHLGTLRKLGDVVAFLDSDSGVSSVVAAPPAPVEQPAVVAAARTVTTADGGEAATLLAVIAEKTGYPAEMLQLDMELDADLGIDSIKRVEIFSTVQEKLPHAPAVKPEHLGTLRTLRQVADFLAGSHGHTNGHTNGATHGTPVAVEPPPLPIPTPENRLLPPELPPAPVAPAKKPTGGEKLLRLVPEAAPLDNTVRARIDLSKRHEIWLTEDDAGLAAALARKLKRMGHQIRLVKLYSPPPVPAHLSGLILVAARDNDDVFLASAFRLTQKTAPALRTARGILATVSRLDGTFGLTAVTAKSNLLSGGLAGLTKTAQHEWPEVYCKAFDVWPGFKDIDAVTVHLSEELFLQGPIEVGITAEGRQQIRLSEKPWPAGDAPLSLQPGDVVVVSGGARGVTAETALALAHACQPTLVLLGRSPTPTPEPDWLAPLTAEAEIKRALLEQAGGKASPREIGEQCQQVLAQREVRRNLERLEAVGATVLYRQADLLDQTAVCTVLDEIRATHGPVRGLIHGAGVLADRAILELTVDQFKQVYNTKVAGLRNLLAAVENDPLKVVALFSSTTARWGRKGQAAYAVANEILNKWAALLAHDRPECRVVSLNWGPWDGGMVTPSLKQMFAQEGIGVIPLEAGGDFLVRELQQPTGTATEVVVMANLPAMLAEPTLPPALANPATMLEREVSVANCPVLEDHVLGGQAVVPLVLTMEWLAHTALHGSPGMAFHGINQLHIQKAIRLGAEELCKLRFLAGKAVRQKDSEVVPVAVQCVPARGEPFLHATAEVVLTSRLPRAEAITLGPLDLSWVVDEIYPGHLFHGPAFQGIRQIDGADGRLIQAEVATSPPPDRWLRHPLRNSWLADPRAIDAGLQLVILWCQQHHSVASLPVHLGRYRQFRRSFPRESVRVSMKITREYGMKIQADLLFLESSGTIVAMLEEVEFILDASLQEAFRQHRLPQPVAALS
jgi:acyl transferase domain-containing protein/NAD(P)-dependent dehydrogenase (short-subunit alcohol dehydrogenase family)